MVQEAIIAAFFDELEKIAASYQMAGHLKSRSGVRPIRASTLLAKDTSFASRQAPQAPQEYPGYADTKSMGELVSDTASSSSSTGDVGAEASVEKTSAQKRRDRLMEGFATARPYVVSGVKAGVPAALLGKVFFGDKSAKGLAVVGSGLGVANQALKDWAEKHKRKAVAKKLLGT